MFSQVRGVHSVLKSQSIKIIFLAYSPCFLHFLLYSFEHACHVTQTVLKLFSRMSSDGTNESNRLDERSDCISSDFLAVFACAFAALIHDVDHPGVPNLIFSTENPALAMKYKGRCIAEQNSFDVAWNLLSEERFSDLRNAIFSSESEKSRFRQLVINAVMATDLFDRELTQWRNVRWERAFGADNLAAEEESPIQVLDRKATILIELLIQSSDISHTMQHW